MYKHEDTIKDTVKFFSSHPMMHRVTEESRNLSAKERQARLTEKVVHYQECSVSDPETAEQLKLDIFFDCFFLLVSMFKNSKVPIQKETFEELIQNACIKFFDYLDNYDISRNDNFAAYLYSNFLGRATYRETIFQEQLVKPTVAHAVSNYMTRYRMIDPQESEEFDGEVGADDSCNSKPTAYYPVTTSICAKETQKDRSGPLMNQEVMKAMERHDMDSPSMEDLMFSNTLRGVFADFLDRDAGYLSEAERITLIHRAGLLGNPVLKLDAIRAVLRSKGTAVSAPRVSQYYKSAKRKLKAYLLARGISG